MTEALTAVRILPYGGAHSEVIPHLTIAIGDDPVVLDLAEADAAGDSRSPTWSMRRVWSTTRAGGCSTASPSAE